MNNLRKRFIFSLGILMVVVFLVLGLIIGLVFRNYHLNTHVKHLKHDSSLIAESINHADQSELGSTLELISTNLGIEITLSDLKENILYSNAKEDQDNYIHRIIKRLGTIETDNHYFENNTNQMLFWELIEVDNEEHILLLSTTIDDLEEISENIWLALFVILSILFLVFLFLGIRIINQYTKPLDSATNVAIELAEGNYHARTYEDSNNEIGVLNTAINILARNLQKITKEQQMQTDRLKTIIENMGMALLTINDKGLVSIMNRPYQKLFSKDESILNQPYTEAISHREVQKIIEEVLMTEKRIRKEVRIPIGIQIMHFQIYAAPIISGDKEWKGIVLVFHDITELKKLEQVRKDFVANVSHELKTPVTSIRGFAETLLGGALRDEEALVEFLQIILKESERLQVLISDLLELSKIEKDGFNLQLKRCELGKIVHEVLHSIEKKAEKKDITIEVKESQDTWIEGDPVRIQQIIVNLVSNAISYTPVGGQIEIAIKNENDMVKFLIRDTGIGIDEAEIPRIFERFYRVDKARSRNSGGTGLGLAIVKHLVEAHRGTIEVQSKLGKGSTFIVGFYKKIPINTLFTKN